MLTYKYEARDAHSGEKVVAEVEAENEQAATKLIRQAGLNPTQITLKGAEGGTLGKFFKKIKTKDKVLFSRQLSTLINAGLPLIQSLRSVGSQTTNTKLKSVIDEVISDIEGGSAFSAALARYPNVFDHVYISLVAAGEASGTLDAALERLTSRKRTPKS